MAEKYYKGNNIGLTFDGTGWKLNNLPQNFINPEAFSTKDPVFPKVPISIETAPISTEQEKDPCPPGYVFDKALNQCVPDPNYQTDFLGQQETRTDKPDDEVEYVDFKKMNLEEMEDWGKSKGLIDEGGFFTGYRKTPLAKFGTIGAVAQFGLYSQDTRFINELRKKGAKIYNPNEQDNLEGNLYIPKFSTTPLRQKTKPTSDLKGGVYTPKDLQDDIDTAQKQKEISLLQKEREQAQEKRNIQNTIRRAEEIEKRKETVGQTGGPAGGGFIPRPSSRPEPKPKPSPPNTSPIGGTGQTYSQFKRR